jgi:hypothetical protein
VAPLRPPGRAEQLQRRLVEALGAQRPGGERVRHGGERLAEPLGHGLPGLCRLDELDLRAVQVGHHRHVRPATGHRVVLRREVVEVEDVGPVGSGGGEGRLPDEREVVGERRVDGGEHHVRRVLAVLERGVHRHRRRHRAAAGLEGGDRGGVVERRQLDAREERGGVGLLAGDAERAGHQRHRPPGIAERDGQVPGDLGRASPGEEEEAHDDPTVVHRRTLRPPDATPGRSATMVPVGGAGERAGGRRRRWMVPVTGRSGGRGAAVTVAAEDDGADGERSLLSWRDEFPAVSRTTFLGTHTLAPLGHRARAAVDRFLDAWQEKASAERLWFEDVIPEMRRLEGLYARIIGADPDEVALTPSVSAGLSSLQSAVAFTGERREVVLSDEEFPADSLVWLAAEARGAVVVPVAGRSTGAYLSRWAPGRRW